MTSEPSEGNPGGPLVDDFEWDNFDDLQPDTVADEHTGKDPSPTGVGLRVGRFRLFAAGHDSG